MAALDSVLQPASQTGFSRLFQNPVVPGFGISIDRSYPSIRDPIDTPGDEGQSPVATTGERGLIMFVRQTLAMVSASLLMSAALSCAMPQQASAQSAKSKAAAKNDPKTPEKKSDKKSDAKSEAKAAAAGGAEPTLVGQFGTWGAY